MDIQLGRGRILAEILSGESVSEGGIFLPETKKSKPHRGRVVAVGLPDIHRLTGEEIPLEVEKGDIVHWKKAKGVPHEIEGKKHIFLWVEDIVAYERG